MVCKIADGYAADVIDVLTGFKFVGEKISKFIEKIAQYY